MSWTDFVGRLLHRPFERKFSGRIPPDHIIGEVAPGTGFEADASYLTIRLEEMFLRHGRDYLRGFSPLVLLVADLIYGDQRRGFPFLVGSEHLKEFQEDVAGEHVEFRHTRVVGPVPYVGDEVSVFLGLCRTEIHDVAEQLFRLVETLSRTLDVGGLSRFVEIAGPLRDGLADILGMKAVELRLAHHHTYTGVNGDPDGLRPGYVVYINGPEGDVDAGQLWVKENRLYRGTSASALTFYDAHDFCLLRLDRSAQRADYVTLPFHRSWTVAKQAVFKGDTGSARRALMELVRAVAVSPDLTTEHRYRLIQVYTADFERDRQVAEQLHGRGRGRARRDGGVGTRGGGGGSFQAGVAEAIRAGLPRDGIEGLLEIGHAWDPMIEPYDPGIEVTAGTLQAQMDTMRRLSQRRAVDPPALASVIAFRTLTEDR
jgi:hypothetical protein